MSGNQALMMLVPAFLSFSNITVSAGDPKQEALKRFEAADYPKAIELLKDALESDRNDPEIYYYLGYFTHYLCYDSVPLTGFGLKKSDEVLEYLFKAVELDPGYGDAYYFIGAEYGARARKYLSAGETGKASEEFRLARAGGGMPDWLIEFGRNHLDSCDKDAILITGGDAETNAVQYLQLAESYRTDVSVIPAALLDRPWFVIVIKKGIEGVMPPVPVSWSRDQILNMHPYKWKTNTVVLPVDEKVKREFDMDDDIEFELAPDMGPGRLSVGAAVLFDILKTNRFRRPVYFSVTLSGDFHGLNEYFRLTGLSRMLVPVRGKDGGEGVEPDRIKRALMRSDRYRSVCTVLEKDMPRVSNILNNYRAVLLRLMLHYQGLGEKEPARDVMDFMDEAIPESCVPPGNYEEYLQKFREALE